MEQLRVLTIGRGHHVVQRLTRALTAAGHVAVASTRIDSADDPVLAAAYDVVGFGRAVRLDMRDRCTQILREHNPDVVAYVGMFPEVGVLMGQIEYEVTRARGREDRVSDFGVEGRSAVRFRVARDIELRFRLRRVNPFFQPSERTFRTGSFAPGVHLLPVSYEHRLRMGNNFLQVDTDGTIVFTAPV